MLNAGLSTVVLPSDLSSLSLGESSLFFRFVVQQVRLFHGNNSLIRLQKVVEKYEGNIPPLKRGFHAANGLLISFNGRLINFLGVYPAFLAFRVVTCFVFASHHRNDLP